MDALILALDTVLQEGKVLVEDLKKQKIAQNSQQHHLDEVAKELKQKTDDFATRESQIIPIENLHEFKKEAQEIMQKATEDKNQLVADRKAFEDYKISETGRINEMRTMASKESDNVIEARKQIDAEVTKRVTEALKNLGIKV